MPFEEELNYPVNGTWRSLPCHHYEICIFKGIERVKGEITESRIKRG